MPELPEVETVRRVLACRILEQRIEKIILHKQRLLRGQSERAFTAGLIHRTIRGVERRAKFLIIRLDQNNLLAHLGMSGQILVAAAGQKLAGIPDKHTHLVLSLDGGATVYFRDPRMFGRLLLLSDAGVEAFFAGYGPEPLGPGFQPDALYAAIHKRSASIKSLLLNQAVVAGIGNIYADESLHRAGLRPSRPGRALTRAQAARLHHAIREVLAEAVASQGTSISDFCDPDHRPGNFQMQLKVYGRKGEFCPTCRQAVIRKAVVAQRGTHWCPRCQK